MEIILIIVGVLIIAYLLYLGNRRRQVKEAERREALGAQAEGHRSIASEHDRKASELADQAERERQSADLHQERAAEVDPAVDTDDRVDRDDVDRDRVDRDAVVDRDDSVVRDDSVAREDVDTERDRR